MVGDLHVIFGTGPATRSSSGCALEKPNTSRRSARLAAIFRAIGVIIGFFASGRKGDAWPP